MALRPAPGDASAIGVRGVGDARLRGRWARGLRHEPLQVRGSPRAPPRQSAGPPLLTPGCLAAPEPSVGAWACCDPCGESRLGETGLQLGQKRNLSWRVEWGSVVGLRHGSTPKSGVTTVLAGLACTYFSKGH